jgi:hypothetical protein
MINDLLQPDSPRVAYDIRRDAAGVEKMRRASLSDGPWGLATDYGLVGSGTWWSALDTGRIKIESFIGTIRVVAGGMKGDTLEVHVEAEDEKQRWVAWRTFDITLDGKKVCIRYIQMRPKKPLPSRPDFLVPVLLQVEIVD